MATKDEAARRKRVTARLTQLIAKVSDQATFCRTVWPREDPDANKAKVSKWKNGASIRPDEAVQVAAAFRVRAAWILGLDDLPEYEGVTRTEAKLGADLAAYMLKEGVRAAGSMHEQWIAETLVRIIDGETLLRRVVALAAPELADQAAFFRGRLTIAAEIDRIKAAVASHSTFNVKETLQILETINMQPPPEGRFFSWKPRNAAPESTPRSATRAKSKPTTRRK